MRRNIFWIILIAALFLISAIASIAIYVFHGSGNTVSIYQNGSIIEKIHLDTVTTPYEFTVETGEGGYNTIKVEQGRVCVSDASCPDHVCINTGWISDGVIPIVCLPNELVIQVDSKEDSALDGASQ